MISRWEKQNEIFNLLLILTKHDDAYAKNMIRVVMKRQMNTKGWWMVMGGQIGYMEIFKHR
jgi:hypothetical protein